jgi:hypothetical protein
MRRPSIRSLAGGAAGIAAGVATGIALTAVSTAGPSVVPATAAPLIDAAHVPPLLRLPGEPVRLRYSLVCTPRGDGSPCDGSGTVYVRAGAGGAFRPLPLQRGDESKDGRYYADVPPDVAASAGGFSYYAVLRDGTTGAAVTVPAGGAAAPQLSLALREPMHVTLGSHEFGRTRRPAAHVVEARWGSGATDVGLAGSRELGFSGPSSFDVEADGTVDVLDSVNGRIVRWLQRRVDDVPLDVRPGLADFAAESDGSFDVLEPAGMLRRFRADGTPVWTQKLADRTWARLEHGPEGPVVFQDPAEQWLPAADARGPLTRSEQAQAAHNGKPLADGRELLVERVGEGELRLAEVAATSIVRSWRITSATSLGDVQLAQPERNRVVVVTRAYTGDRDEFLVLLLDRGGLVARFSADSDSWTETAPLARFRLGGGSLYRLRTSPTGMSVDRFDLEVPR